MGVGRELSPGPGWSVWLGVGKDGAGRGTEEAVREPQLPILLDAPRAPPLASSRDSPASPPTPLPAPPPEVSFQAGGPGREGGRGALSENPALSFLARIVADAADVG